MAVKGVVPAADYTFNAVAKTITFSSAYTGLALSDIMLVINVVDSIIIYDTLDSTKSGTLVGLVLTLTYDTIAMSNTDSLQVIIGRNFGVDNSQLYSNTLSVSGAITGIDTSNYSNIVIQLSGSWNANIIVEGSNDNSTWTPLLTTNVNEINVQDLIIGNGIYQFNTSSKYFRLNVTRYQSGTITVLIFGRNGVGINAADRLSLAMDKQAGLPLYVSEVDTRKDGRNALIPSDAPNFIYGYASATGAEILPKTDTTGYQCIVVQIITAGTTLTMQSSNDGVNWSSLTGYSASSSAPTSSISSTGLFMFPCLGRFVRIVTSGATFTNLIAYLRQQPLVSSLVTSGSPVNLSSIGGTNAVSAGVSGMLAVGGNIAPGVAPTANPVLVGGIDTSGLTRRFLTDLSGRLITALIDQAGTARGIGGFAPAVSNLGVASQAVQDISVLDGQTTLDYLSQILLELKINNHYLFELPTILQKLLNDTSKIMIGFSNEPQEFRNEQSIFNS